MIVYHQEWLDNQRTRTEAKRALNTGLITAEEMKKIELRYPVGFYSPNVFVRAGLFLLTLLVIVFSCGLVFLILSDANVLEHPVTYVILGILTYIVLLAFVKGKHHLHSGVDDALMWASGGLFLAAFFFAEEHPSYYLTSGFIFLLSSLYVLQFADGLMSMLNFGAFFCMAFFGWRSFPWGMSTMPFLIMLLSAGTYVLTRILLKKPATVNYRHCLQVVQVLSLLVLYLAGNYYVVQALSTTGEVIVEHPAPVPFAPFFWTWTILVPFAYVYAGLKNKDVLLVRSGLLLIAAAGLTFRNYYHVLAIEAALSIIGVLLLSVAYSTIKYLKHPKHGFTREDLGDDRLLDKMRVESLIVSETFSSGPGQGEESRFGGGNFGGGGASSSF